MHRIQTLHRARDPANTPISLLALAGIASNVTTAGGRSFRWSIEYEIAEAGAAIFFVVRFKGVEEAEPVTNFVHSSQAEAEVAAVSWEGIGAAYDAV